MTSLSLRARFILAGTLVVIVTCATGVWSALTFAHVSRSVGVAVREDEASTALVTALASSLEDEDDALLLALMGETESAARELAKERGRFDDAFARLAALAETRDERMMLDTLRHDVDEYRASGDFVVARASNGREAHTIDATPRLRIAVGDYTRIREHRVHATQNVAVWARDEARRATWVVSIVALFALGISGLIAIQLARAVIGPIRELTESAEAMRNGDFERRVDAARPDELGQLAGGFNRMAETLSEFRRSNLGEVLRAKETLESTLAALPDAVLVVDPQGRVVSANPRARSVLVAFCGRVPRELDEIPLSPDARSEVIAALDGRTSDEPADFSRAMSIAVDGETRRFLPRVVPIPGTVKKRFGAVVVLYDVTELARLDEMRVEFVAAASHELRTPLTTLQMTLPLLAEAPIAFTARQREMLATAIAGCEQLSATVDEFLDVTHIEAGQLRLTQEHVAVGALVLAAVRSVRVGYEDAGVSLTVDDQARSAAIFGDLARLQVVFSNVLGNALKYSARGDEVVVLVVANDGAVEISIDDTGPGVPEELCERIFEKYFRVEHCAPRAGPSVRGAGIGLYLSRQIVAAHRGTIRCSRGRRGSGARFVIRLQQSLRSREREECAAPR